MDPSKRPEHAAMLAEAPGTEYSRDSASRRERSKNYKPTAIRAPVLLLFAAILGLCIGLIEVLLHEVDKTATLATDSGNTYNNNNNNNNNRRSLERRTTNGHSCQELPAITSSLLAIDRSLTKVCSTWFESYSSLAKAKSKLNPVQSAAFQQWLGTFSPLDSRSYSLTSDRMWVTRDCRNLNMTTLPGYSAVPTAVRMNCDYLTSPNIVECPATGTFRIVNGTISEGQTIVCAAAASQMMTITSNSPTPAKTTSDLATITSAPSAAAPSREMTIASQTSVQSKSASANLPTLQAAPTSPSPSQSTASPQTQISNTQAQTQSQSQPTAIQETTVSAVTSSKLMSITSQTVTLADTPSTSLPIISPDSSLIPAGSGSSPSGVSTMVTSGLSGLPTQLTSVSSKVLTQVSSGSSGVQTQLTSGLSGISMHSTSVLTVGTGTPAASTNIAKLGAGSSSSETSTYASSSVQGSSSTAFVVSALLSSSLTRETSESTAAASSTSSSSSSSQTLYTVTTRLTTVVTTTDGQGHTTSFSAIMLQSTVLTTRPGSSMSMPANSTSAPSSTSVTSAAPFRTLAFSEKVVNRTFDKFSYAAALWFPPILAVLIKVVWEIIYSSFVLMEPFRQLSRAHGSPAKKALFTQYLSSSISLSSLKSCFQGQMLPALTMSVYLSVTAVTMLSASSMTVITRDNCQVAPNQYMRCNPAWVINTVILRCIEGLLVLSIILVFCVIAFTRKYKTGVASNPSSIATVASLISQESLLQDFRTVDPNATESELAASMKHRQYRLGWHENALGGVHYGIVRYMDPTFSSLPQRDQSKGVSLLNRFNGYSTVSNPAPASMVSHQRSSLLSRSAQTWILDIIQLVLTVGLFVLVTSYRFDLNSSDAFNTFFNTGHFGPRLVFVALASIVDMQWKSLESEVRTLEPYRRMARGFERPETTVLLNLNGTCWTGLFGSMYRAFAYRNMWFQTLVSSVAVLSDFNIIAVAGVVWVDGQTPMSLDVTSYIAMIITGLMIAVMLTTMFWWRRSVVREMQVTPNTVGAVISYLCSSRFAREMSSAQLESVSQRERDDMLIASGWRFSYRWRAGIDGRERRCVDFETSMSAKEKISYT